MPSTYTGNQHSSMDSNAFTQRLCERTGMAPEQATAMQEALTDIIIEQIREGNSVALQGFGQFTLKERLPREIFNPATGDFRLIPGSYTLGFRPSKALKTAPSA